MTALRIAVLDDYQRVAAGMADWASLAPRAAVDYFHEPFAPEAAAAALAPYDVLVTMRERTRIDAALLARLPRLKLVTTIGERNAAIDLEAAARQGVAVAGTRPRPGGSTATATLAWGLVIMLTRGLYAEAASVRAGGWQAGVGVDLTGKTLGLLGLGRLGRQMAAFGRAFGMEVVAWSTNLTPGAAREAGARRVSREELFALADVLSIHLVLSDRTRGLVDDAALRRMKPDAFLVNTSRGPIVDEAALISALGEGRLRGAALDVFDAEPLPAGHPFRTFGNVLATPHIGYVTEETYRVGYGAMVGQIRAFLDGEPLFLLAP